MFISLANNKNINKCNHFASLSRFGAVFSFILLVFAFLFNMNNFNFNNFTVAETTSETSIEEEIGESIEDVIDDIDFSGLENTLQNINIDFNLFGDRSFKEFVQAVIKGEETIELKDLFNIILSGLKESFKNLLAPLLTILVVVLLCTMFNNIKAQKLSGVSEIIYFVCFAVIVVIVSTMVAGLIEKSKNSLSSLQNQMNAVFPILLSLMTLMGGAISVKAYTPLLAFLTNAISNIFVYILLPLFSFSLVLSIIGNLSENTKLSKLNGFINSIFKWVIGVVFAIFMGFLSIKGITAGASDGISIKATKYAIKNYVPMLGGYISEGFELIKAGGMLVKNATGFASIALLTSTIVVPVISIAMVELGLKFLAGVIEPIGDKKSSNLLFSIASSLKLLVVILIGVALMYFLTIFLIVCSVTSFV